MSKLNEQRTYPRQAWVLMPSFKPAEITIKSRYGSASYNGYDLSEKGKIYHISDLFESEADAIAEGRRKIIKLEQDIKKRTETMRKRCANLGKAEANLARTTK